MKYCYIEDLDELILYRYDEFTEETLSQFTILEIETWNKYIENYGLEQGNIPQFDKTDIKEFA